MRPLRLRGRKVVDRVRKRGSKWRGKHMMMIYLPLDAAQKRLEAGSYQLKAVSCQLLVGAIAPTTLHKSAVKRNRMRRRCREALRVELGTGDWGLEASVQLLIAPRSSSLTCDFGELLHDARNFLRHVQER